MVVPSQVQMLFMRMRTSDEGALFRLRRFGADAVTLTLDHARAILAFEHGFPTWEMLDCAGPEEAARGERCAAARKEELTFWLWLAETAKKMRNDPTLRRGYACDFLAGAGRVNADTMQRACDDAGFPELGQAAHAATVTLQVLAQR